MSGLLRRLGARAIGVAPNVRAVGGWAAAPVRPSYAESPLPSHEREPERGVSWQPQAAVDAAESHVVREVPAGHAAFEPPSFEREQLAEIAPGLPARPRRRVRPPLAVESDARAASPLEFGNSVQPSSPTSRTARGIGDGIDPPAPAARDRRRAPRAYFLDAAPPLLPPRPLAQALPPRAVAAPGSRPVTAAPAAVEETTEVHVTIGRIEVTALHEAPPPRREPGRTRKPKSLEDYLASRQERRT